MCGFTRSMSCSNYEFSVAPGSIHGLRVAPCVGTTETPLLGFPARLTSTGQHWHLSSPSSTDNQVFFNLRELRAVPLGVLTWTFVDRH